MLVSAVTVLAMSFFEWHAVTTTSNKVIVSFRISAPLKVNIFRLCVEARAVFISKLAMAMYGRSGELRAEFLYQSHERRLLCRGACVFCGFAVRGKAADITDAD